MNIPVIRPARTDPLLVKLLKRVLRTICHLPVRTRMFLDKSYPWLNHGAVLWLKAHLKPEMAGIEWGSGRSTIFISEKISRLISIEHNAKWAKRVQATINKKRLAEKIEYHLIQPSTRSTLAQRRPPQWETLGHEPTKPEFSAYFDQVLAYPDDSFDVALIDGRARVECALNVLDKIRPGGFLILDNSEWPKYLPIFLLTRGWKKEAFRNGVWETTVFQKPIQTK